MQERYYIYSGLHLVCLDRCCIYSGLHLVCLDIHFLVHLFLATMDAGHFWSVIAVQMQHLVLCTSSLPFHFALQ